MAANNEVLKLSLKQYKKDMDELKASLLGLERGSAEYAKTLSDLQAKQQKLNQVTRDAKRDDDALEGSYNGLVASMARLKEEWRATNDIAKRNELGQQIESINTQLKELDLSIGNSQRNVGNYESGTVSLRKQVKELRIEMENMLARGISQADPAYKALAERAGEMQDAIDDAKSSVKEYANDVRGMAIGVDVAKNIAAGYGAATSAMELFGASTEDAQKITAKMSTVMTLLNSLQQINTALMDSSSPTRKLAIELWQQLTGAKEKDIVATTQSTSAEVANNATVNAGTIAMNANKKATEGATIATKGFRKALVSTGIGAIIVALGLLIANFEKITKTVKGWLGIEDKEAQKAKEAAAAQERHAQAMKDLDFQYNSTTKVVNDINAKFEVLKAKVKAAEGNIRAQKQVLEYYRKEWGFLGKDVKNYSDLVVKLNGEITKRLREYTEVRIAQTKYELAAKAQAEAEYQVEKLKGMREDAQEEIRIEHQKEVKKAEERYKALKKQREENPTMAAQADVEGAYKYWQSLAGIQKFLTGGTINANLDKAQERLTKATLETNKYVQEMAKAEAKYGDFANTTAKTIGTSTANAVDPLKEVINQSKADLDELKNVLENVFSLYEDDMKAAEKDYKEKTRGAKSEKERLEIEQEYLKERLRIMTETTNVYEQLEKSLFNYNPMLGRNYEDVDVTPEIKELFDKVKTLREEDLLALSVALKQADDKMVDFLEDNDDRLYENSKKRKEQAIADAKYMVSYLDNLLSLDEQRVNNAYDKAEVGKSEQDTVELEKRRQEALYDLRKESLEKQLKLSEETLKIMTPETEAYDQQSLAIENLKSKLEALNIAEIKRTGEAQKNTKKNIQVYTQWATSIASIMSTVVSAQQNQLQNELNNGKISQKEAEKRFESMKQFQIAATVIETLAGATATFMLTAADKSIQPTFVRMATASLLAANTLAQGYAQINQIKSTTLGGASSSSGGGAYNSGSNIATAPLLNPTLDSLSLQNISVGEMQGIRQGQNDQRVYILEADLQKSNRRVEVREHSTTF